MKTGRPGYAQGSYAGSFCVLETRSTRRNALLRANLKQNRGMRAPKLAELAELGNGPLRGGSHYGILRSQRANTAAP